MKKENKKVIIFPGKYRNAEGIGQEDYNFDNSSSDDISVKCLEEKYEFICLLLELEENFEYYDIYIEKYPDTKKVKVMYIRILIDDEKEMKYKYDKKFFSMSDRIVYDELVEKIKESYQRLVFLYELITKAVREEDIYKLHDEDEYIYNSIKKKFHNMQKRITSN